MANGGIRITRPELHFIQDRPWHVLLLCPLADVIDRSADSAARIFEPPRRCACGRQMAIKIELNSRERSGNRLRGDTESAAASYATDADDFVIVVI